MEYKLHRVARNSNGWMRPSPGRLGAKGVGSYVEQNGFGLEDWNFNFSLAFEGKMYGYTVAQPAAKLTTEEFGVILATYDPQGWSAVGYYNGARFSNRTGNYPHAAVQQMAADVFELAEKNFLASKFRGMTLLKIEETIQHELINRCWITPTSQVFVFEFPARIPEMIFSPDAQRMATSFNLSEDKFNQITKLGRVETDQDTEIEHEEGKLTLKLHESRERNPGLISAFKNSLNSFACVVCSFDFESRYGPLGKAFIECHHIRPVAEMRPGDKTKMSDLRAVCSNCHRMLHRASPMLTIEALRGMIKQPE